MRRTARSLACLAAVTILTLAGCGDDDSPSATTEEQTTESSPTASPSESPSAVAGECTPPASDITYTSGEASLDVTAGPDTGHYDLVLDTSDTNAYAASDKEITGNWLSADEQAVLFIDIEGADPCQPDAFTSIATQGAGGPIFVDSSHTACTVEVTLLDETGVSGTFTCTGLTGGGEGLERDAEGTFTLAP